MSTPNTVPVTPRVCNNKQSQLTTGDTSRTAPSTFVNVWTPIDVGSALSKVVFEFAGVSSANTIRLFWYDGTNMYLYKEFTIPAVTPSNTLAAYRFEYVPTTPEVYANPWVLRATIDQTPAQGVTCLVQGADY